MADMKRTSEEKCPECGSKDIRRTGIRTGEIGGGHPDGTVALPEANEEMCECLACKAEFVLIIRTEA